MLNLYPEVTMDTSTQPKLNKRQNIWLIIKFVLFSISAGIIEVGSYTILHELTNIDQYTKLDELIGSEYGLTYFIALVLSVMWNFTFNRKFTFKSAANIPIAMLKVFAYYCIFAPLSIWWTVKLTGLYWTSFNDYKEYIVLVFTMLINLTTEFTYCRFVVYRKSLYTNKAGKRELSETSDSNS